MQYQTRAIFQITRHFSNKPNLFWTLQIHSFFLFKDHPPGSVFSHRELFANEELTRHYFIKTVNKRNSIAYLKYGAGIYNLDFSIILFNTFTDNVTNFVGSNGYHEFFLIIF
ncbi:ATP synthase subunit alpha chloroplastic [Phtheirospermum japonicum]|uniref:ATP synthase subunit alpha chloroplastic n=1 Tax=Phtheirospermum japonicum TaxID=374723 RepID=A0A830B6I3_9LAMI|nr:ATP synthase subunit alpha chloroplastic [Phtheirospermum japonicum]